MLLTIQKTLKALQTHLHEFFKEWSRICGAMPSATGGAFTHARAKLSPGAFVELNEKTVLDVFYHSRHQTAVRLWRGHRLLGVDSSLVRLPNHKSVFKSFTEVQCRNQSGVLDRYPEGRISVLYDLLNHLGLDAQLTGSVHGELELARAHLLKTRPKDLIITDRGYAGYRWLAEQAPHGLDFVCRCSRGSFGIAQELFARNEAAISVTVTLDANAAIRGELTKLGLPQQLRVRFVTVRLSTGELEVLATSLLDENEYPTEVFAELYWKRWGIETYYGRLKGRLDLENFSGETETAVRQDFQAMVFLSNLETIVSAPVQARETASPPGHRKHSRQINRAVSLHALKSHMIELLASATPAEMILAQLERWIIKNPVSVRAARPVLRRKPSALRSYHFHRRVRKAVF